MTERQQPGKTEQQVEGAGKNGEAQQFHDKHRIKPEHGRQQRQQQQPDIGHANEFLGACHSGFFPKKAGGAEHQDDDHNDKDHDA